MENIRGEARLCFKAFSGENRPGLIHLSMLAWSLVGLLYAQSGMVYYADHVLHNGKIVTVDGESIVQALAIRDGKLVEVGSNQQALRHAGSRTTVIDLQGRTVLPGLVDTHSHPHESSLSPRQRKVKSEDQ